MQLIAKEILSSSEFLLVLLFDRRACKSEVNCFLECRTYMNEHIAKGRTVAFVKYYNYPLAIYFFYIPSVVIGQLHAAHLLNGGNNENVIIILQLGYQVVGICRVLHFRVLSGREVLILQSRLRVEFYTVNEEDNLVGITRIGYQQCRLKTGHGFTATRGMSNIATPVVYVCPLLFFYFCHFE